MTNKTILFFDEVNALSSLSLTIEDVKSILINAYVTGVKSCCEMLLWDFEQVDIDIEDMYEALYVLIDDKTFEDRYNDHIENETSITTLIQSESHRMHEQGASNTAKTINEISDREVGKKWNTMLDNKVRGTHDYLEGMSVGLNEEFYTYDGDHAAYPGGFDKVENNANCRCVCDYFYMT